MIVGISVVWLLVYIYTIHFTSMAACTYSNEAGVVYWLLTGCVLFTCSVLLQDWIVLNQNKGESLESNNAVSA